MNIFKRRKIWDLRHFQKRNYSSLLFLFYVLSLGFLVLRHEPWRDEVSPWLQTKNATWAEVVYRSGLELQSPLFFSTLKLIQFVSDNYNAYRLFMFVISVATAFLLLKFFSKNSKILLLIFSNYYFVYEFAVIQRIYTLTLFLVVLTLVLIRRDVKHGDTPTSLTLVCFTLLSLISVWGLIFSLTILITMALRGALICSRNFVVFFGIISVSNILFLIFSTDRDWGVTTGDANRYLSLYTFSQLVTASLRSFVFLPSSQIHGWNSNLLFTASPVVYLSWVVVCSLIYLFLFNLSRKVDKVQLVFFFGLAILSFLVGLGKQRHLGQIVVFIFIWLIVGWILQDRLNLRFAFNPKMLNLILSFFLTLNLFQTAVTVIREVNYKFSTSADLSYFVKPDDLLIVQDSGKNTFLPLVIKSNFSVFNYYSASYEQVALLNQQSRSMPPLDRVVDRFELLCRKLSPNRILLFTDSDTLARVKKSELALVSVSGEAIVNNEGRRELWALAHGRDAIQVFCEKNQLNSFFIGLKVPIVGYGE